MARTLEDTIAELEQRHPEDRPIIYRGQIWTTPFKCMNCGTVIPAYQFAFARACARCDVGRGPQYSVTVMCENGHVLGRDLKPWAPMAPEDDAWMLSSRGHYYGGVYPCRCREIALEAEQKEK